MTEIKTNAIPHRLKNVNKQHPYVSGARDIYDDVKGKSQAEVNADVDDTFALHQSEINALDSQNYVTVATYSALPATGSADTIYRVSSYDGTQVDDTVYSEYAWNGSAYVHLSTKTQIGEVFDISAYHATGGTLAKYADLAAALNGGANIPQSLQKGGMSVKYVRTSDNKYVQYRYMSSSTAVAEFINVANWQGVDDEPTAGSKNLVESGAVESRFVEDENRFGYRVDKTYTPGGSRLNVQFDRPIIGGGHYKVTFVSSTGDAVASIRLYRREGTTIVGAYDNISAGSYVEKTQIESNVDNFLFYTFGTVAAGIDIVIRVEYTGGKIDGTRVQEGTIDINAIKPSQIDDIPTENSNNLVKSSGVFSKIDELKNSIYGKSLDEEFTCEIGGRIQIYISASGFAGKSAKVKFSNISGDTISNVSLSYRNANSENISSDTLDAGVETTVNVPVGTVTFLLFKNVSFTQQTKVRFEAKADGDIIEIIDEEIDKKDDKSLKGLNIVSFGDSVWEFTGSDGKGIIEHLQEISGCETIYKGAIGGSRLVVRRTPVENPTDAYGAYAELDVAYLVNAWATKNWTAVDNAVTWLKNNTSDDNSQIIQNLKDCPIEDTDIVLITGGGNDSKNSIALGNPSDLPAIRTTTCAALSYAIQSILAVNPKIKIFYMSPFVRYTENTNPPEERYWGDVWENNANRNDTTINCASTDTQISESVDNLSEFANRSIDLSFENISGDELENVTVRYMSSDNIEISNFVLSAGAANKARVITPSNLSYIVIDKEISLTQASVYKFSILYGPTLAVASDTLRNAAKYLHIPSCDLYWGLGWNKTNFMEFHSSVDLTHPTNYKPVAEKVYSYLISHL